MGSQHGSDIGTACVAEGAKANLLGDQLLQQSLQAREQGHGAW